MSPIHAFLRTANAWRERLSDIAKQARDPCRQNRLAVLAVAAEAPQPAHQVQAAGPYHNRHFVKLATSASQKTHGHKESSKWSSRLKSFFFVLSNNKLNVPFASRGLLDIIVFI